VSRAARVASMTMAVLMPLLVVAAGLAGLESFRTASDKRENRNAGKVINGRVVQGGVVGMIERSLAANDPEVIILGNSLSNTDLQPALLARRLGIRKNRIQRYSVPNSIGAHWFLILKNRVYGNGYAPKLVILLSDMQSALAVTPRSEASYNNLSVHMNRREPKINRKLGERNYYLERVRQNRSTLRDKALEGARNAMVDLLYHQSFAPTDSRATEAALDRVFDASNTDMRLHNQVIPIFAEKAKLQPFDPADLPLPKDSFIPEITRMVSDNGGTAVFLRPPMSPMLPEELGDVVLPEVEPRAINMVERRGGLYLDTRQLPLQATHFHNVDHMNGEGARHYTEAVSRVLWELPKLADWRPWDGAEVDLLRFVEVTAGVATPRFPDAVYRKEPPAVPKGTKPFQRGRKGMPYFDTSHLHYLADTSTIELNPAARRCSPIRVLENGEPLPLGNVSCDEVAKHRKGRYCHNNDKIYFSASDDSSPFLNDREYTLDLDPERRCWGAQWLYPNDQVRIRSTEGDFEDFENGARALTLMARTRSKRGAEADPAWLRVKVWANDKLRLDEVITADALGGRRGHTFRLGKPIRPGSDVLLEVVNDSDSFVVLGTARFTERAPK